MTQSSVWDALTRPAPKKLEAGIDHAAHRPMAEQLSELEAALMKRGFPPMSPWWHATLKRFYGERSGCRQFVLRVGRRGGKSTTITRVAVLEALYGQHKITPGDTGIVGIVSVDRKEAMQRLVLVRTILDALGIKYHDTKDVITLLNKPIKFQVFTASLKAVVGGTWICAICDEVSRWRDEQTGANPALEVLASLRPCLATMPTAKLFLISSPLGLVDAHAKAFDEGDTRYQTVAFAPTWVAHPALTEQRTRELEPNERIWKREYAAVPQGSLTAVFNLDDIDACVALWLGLKIETVGQCVMCIDPSRGHDAWTYCIAHWVWHDGRQRLRVKEIGEVADATDTRTSITWLANKAKEHGCHVVASDQYDASGLAVLFSDVGLTFYPIIWNAKTKREAVDRFDRLMRDRDVALPEHETMRRHLVEYSEKIGRSGGDPTYSGRGKHDDYAAVLLTLTMLELQSKMPIVRSPEVQQSETAQIEQKWWDTLRERRDKQRELERDWGKEDLATHFDNMRYLP